MADVARDEMRLFKKLVQKMKRAGGMDGIDDDYIGPDVFSLTGLPAPSWQPFTAAEVYGDERADDEQIAIASMNDLLLKLSDMASYSETSKVRTFMDDQLLVLDYTRLLVFKERARLRAAGMEMEDYDNDGDAAAEAAFIALFEAEAKQRGRTFDSSLVRDLWDIDLSQPCYVEEARMSGKKQKKKYKPVQQKLSTLRLEDQWFTTASFDASGRRVWELDLRRVLHPSKENAALITYLARNEANNGLMSGILPRAGTDIKGMHGTATFNAGLAVNKGHARLPRTPQKPRGIATRQDTTRPWLFRE